MVRNARLPGAAEQLWTAEQCRGAFVQLHRCALQDISGSGVSDGVPQGQSRPVVSTLNDLTNTIVANAALEAGGYRWRSGHSCNQRHRSGRRCKRLLRATWKRRAVILCANALPKVVDTRRNGGQPFYRELTEMNVVNSPCGPPASSEAYAFHRDCGAVSGSLSYLTLRGPTHGNAAS